MMGPGSLGFDLSYTFFPRRLADRRVLFCKSDKPPCRRHWLGGTWIFSLISCKYVDPDVVTTHFV